MGPAMVVQSLHHGQSGEHGVAVVRGPTAIEPAMGIEVRRPRPQVVTPAYHRGLLIQVTVHQHRVWDAARKLQQEQRRVVAVLQHLKARAWYVLPPNPVRYQRYS